VRTVADVRTADETPVPHASRIAAYLIDVALFAVPGTAGVWVAAGEELRAGMARLIVLKSAPDALLGLGEPGRYPWRLITTVLVLAAFVGAWTLYRVATAAVWQRSVGKLLLGLRVVDVSDRSAAIGWGGSWRRWLPGQALALVPIPAVGMLGYCLAFVRSDRRGMHDLSAGSVVVRSRDETGVAMRGPARR
jgi:uncharacterized RDD family membrane protein YckC